MPPSLDLALVPARLSPWAFQSTTLYLDKCCVSQRDDETKAAGVAGFGRFLGQCEGMIAFVSETYFTRLWCVYELATFCKTHEDVLDEKLLLLSLKWPPIWHPRKSRDLTHDERSWFAGFSCANVRCSKPADRATVLGMIRERWKRPGVAGEAAFDEFVRTRLPAVLQRSKQRYAQQLAHTMHDAFDLAFGG